MSAQPDAENARFWNYVCGSNVRDGQTLDQFDRWFFQRYPWVEKWVPFADLEGLDVLEVGIGSGTTARRIARTANLTALDVAPQPLLTLERESTAPVTTIEGSILSAPLPDEAFDYCVAIGCIHHTGDAQQALRELYRVTRPGGGLTIMVYHKDSGRPMTCWDHDNKGQPAPITAWFTVDEVVAMLEEAGYTQCKAGVEHFIGRAPGGLSVYASAFK